jgi:O-antigen/teichoic acid export membrane protein
MGKKKTIARNAIWNWAGTATNMVAGFVIAPFLVRCLGDTTYGLWILIASLTGYFSLLDLGVRGAVGRQIAFHRARGDQAGVNAALSTAICILCAGAVVAVIATLLAQVLFFHLFDVPPDRVASARLALFVVGINLGLMLLVNAFDATLWAFQRFDLLNAIEIPTTLFRIGLTYLMVGRGADDLVVLALITFFVTVIAGAAKVAMSFRVDRALRLGLAHVSSAAGSPLLGYGSSYFVLSVATLINAQLGPLIIGARVGIALVTPFSIASRLVVYANALVQAGTGVLTPVSTALHAEGKHDQQRKLLLLGAKYCTALSLFFVSIFILLGSPLISLWIGKKMDGAPVLLAILALGEALPMSQGISYGVILGMGRHRGLACLGLLESAVAGVLAILLAKPFGLLGVCIVLAATGTVCRGLLQMAYACRICGVRLSEYFVQALAAFAFAAVPASALGGLVAWRVPRNWFQLLAYMAIYCSLWVVISIVFGIRELSLKSRIAAQVGDGRIAEKVATEFTTELIGN